MSNESKLETKPSPFANRGREANPDALTNAPESVDDLIANQEILTGDDLLDAIDKLYHECDVDMMDFVFRYHQDAALAICSFDQIVPTPNVQRFKTAFKRELSASLNLVVFDDGARLDYVLKLMAAKVPAKMIASETNEPFSAVRASDIKAYLAKCSPEELEDYSEDVICSGWDAHGWMRIPQKLSFV